MTSSPPLPLEEVKIYSHKAARRKNRIHILSLLCSKPSEASDHCLNKPKLFTMTYRVHRLVPYLIPAQYSLAPIPFFLFLPQNLRLLLLDKE